MDKYIWNVVGDRDTRQVWECPDCEDEVDVYPPEYEDIGTPVCEECGVDMFYRHTEVRNA